MFDIFGIEKVDARDSIREMMRGATLGLLDGYECRLEEKDREIERLRKKIAELEERSTKS